MLDKIINGIKADSGEFTVKRTDKFTDIIDLLISNGYMILIEGIGVESIVINFWKKEC